MSEIPYYFDHPTPRYFRDIGWFKNPKSRAFICWCFERCSNDTREVVIGNQKITLKPYEFIFGRKTCSEETGLTEDEVRTQQISMEKALYLKKCPNKTPNRFTIYAWSTDVFFKKDPQQNPQPTPNRPPTEPHNQELIPIDLQKEPDLPLTPSSSSVGSVVEVGGFFGCLASIEIDVAAKQRLSKAFAEQDVIHGVEYTLAQKKKPNDLAGYLFWACKNKPAIPLKIPTLGSEVKPVIDPEEACSRREQFRSLIKSNSVLSKAKIKDVILEDRVTYVSIGQKKIQVDSPTFFKDVGKALAELNLWTPPLKKIENQDQTQKTEKHAGNLAQTILEVISHA